MEDINERAVIGGNNPPKEFATIEDDSAMQRGLANGVLEVETQIEHDQAIAVRDEIKALNKKLDNEHKETKAPHKAICDALDARKREIKNPNDIAIKHINGLITGFLNKQAAAKAAEIERLRLEAEKTAQEAAKLQQSDDIDDKVKADAVHDKAKMLQNTAKKIARGPKGTRTQKTAVIDDHIKTSRWIWEYDRQAIEQFNQEYAQRNLGANIDGVTIKTEEKAI